MRWVQEQLGLCWEGAGGRLQGTAGGQLSLCPVGTAGRLGCGSRAWRGSSVGKQPWKQGWRGLVSRAGGWWTPWREAGLRERSASWTQQFSLGLAGLGNTLGRRFCLAGTNVGMLRSALCSQQALALLQTDGR